MKLSLAWIFDHIEEDWQRISVDSIVQRFNQVTAEIEGFDEVAYDWSSFVVARVEKVAGHTANLVIPELQQNIELAGRDD